MGSLSINRVVSDIFLAYDHNKNGVIELERPKAQGGLLSKIGNRLNNPDERVRSNTNVYSSEDEIKVSTHVTTRNHLFIAADANKDKKVTPEELKLFISENYDVNKNGELDSRGWKFWQPKGEKQKFNKDYGERTEAYTSISF